LITLYPAGWPVEVKLERDGQQKTIHVRLTALPYEPIAKPMDKPEEEKKPAEEKPAEKPAEEKPADKPAEEKPGEDKPGEEKPGEEKPAEGKQPELPRVKLVPPKPKLELGEPGKIRLKEVNREVAGQILAAWKSAAGAAGGTTAKALRIESEIRRDDAAVGKQLLIASGDGRVRAEYEIDGKRTVAVADGSTYWLLAPGKAVQEVTSAKAILDPHFAQAAVLGCLLSDQSLARCGELALDGSDKAQGRLCYRLSATDPSSEQLFVWLSVYGSAGTPQIELVKSGVGIDDEEPIPSTIYGDFRPVEGVAIPHQRTLVSGLAEAPGLAIVTTNCELLSETGSELFAAPSE
jgi:hypothetical protein